MWIDFGNLGIKKYNAQIKKLYEPNQLIGRLILAVTNFLLREIADFISDVLVLGVVLDDGEVVLIQLDRDADLGQENFIAYFSP
ncbi:export-related chaperone CsaA [Nostoc linckia NIES-25]|nr:export-related chaperone CsaA [Nostoc linckia NIES-25]